MAEDRAHPLERRRVDGLPGALPDSGDPAHGCLLALRRPRCVAPAGHRADISRAIQEARDLNSPVDGADAEYWSSVVESRPPAGGTLWRAHSDAVNARLLERWLPAQAGLRILKTDLFDEAIAPGVYPLLAARAARVVGIDVSPAVVDSAARRYPGLEAHVADVRRLPFAEGTFDVVVSISTLDHFETFADLEAGLAELRRVLAPGGTLVVTLDNGRNPVVALRNRLPLGILRRVGVVPYFVGATCGPRRLRRVLGASAFDVQELTVVLHCPRALAVLGSSLLEAGAREAARRRYLRFLSGFERLERAPTRSLTGYFAAARATRS